MNNMGKRSTIRWFFAVFFLAAVAWEAYAYEALQGPTGVLKNEPGAFDGYTLFSPLMGTTTYLIDMEGNVVHKWKGDHGFGCGAVLLENGNLLRAVSPIRPGGPLGGPKPEDYLPDRTDEFRKVLKEFRNTEKYRKYFEAGGRFEHGGAGGLLQEVDWDGNVVWEYRYSNAQHRQHHDFKRMPNGNTLFIAWEYKTPEECEDAGRPDYLCGSDDDNPHPLGHKGLHADTIVEVNKKGAIVWKWSFWDHLISGFMSWLRPGKLDVNWHTHGVGPPVKGFYDPDWNHINSIDYNPELDQIAINSREMGEFYIIDHSTADYDNPEAGIEKAAGEAGDFLYRWGNPSIRFGDTLLFKRIAPTYETNGLQQLFGAHDIQWIPKGRPGAGHFLIFDNGWARPFFNFSRILEIDPLDDKGNYVPQLNFDREDKGHGWEPMQGAISKQIVWKYNSRGFINFNSFYISGAQRLPNGNTLICSGAQGHVFEVGNEGDNSFTNGINPFDKKNPGVKVFWEFINPITFEGEMELLEDGQVMNGRNALFRAYRYAANFPGLKGRELEPMEDGYEDGTTEMLGGY
ncbi:MAG: hypothetical protein GY866_04220 [Proteobacteria bacterium]|nr:hypothetical protein [Pseudomonadota bacterium]